MLKHLVPVYAQIPAPTPDELLRKEFGGDNAALLSIVFNLMNIRYLQLTQAQSENVHLMKEFLRLKAEVEEIVRKLKQE